MDLGAGLAVGLAGLASGYAVGIAGEAGSICNGMQPKVRARYLSVELTKIRTC